MSSKDNMTASMNALSIKPPSAESAAAKRPSRKARRRQNQRANAAVTNSSIPGHLPSGGAGSSTVRATRVIAPVIPTTFHPYRQLANELKSKIIEMACQEPRIIEIEYGPDRGEGDGPYVNAHHRHRVCPSSRAPPAILQVNSLAREVAKKVYKLRTFDSNENFQREIYFNRDADILYFGENTCVATVLFLLLFKVDIPKVAINCSTKMEHCTDNYDDGLYYVDGGIDVMQALHGFDDSVCRGHRGWDMKVGLTDVYFVIKSNLWRTEVGKMHAGIAMRTATNDGLTDGQRRFKKTCEGRIERIQDGRGVYGVGENKWVGKNRPNFHFTNFGPKTIGVDPRVYDGICVSRYHISHLSTYRERQEKRKFNDMDSVRDIAKKFNVEITIPEPSYPQENPREIGFFGLRDAVDKAKVAIKERIEFKPQNARW